MSQHDFDIADAAGSTVRGDLNNAIQALASLSSGASAPSPTYANMWWVDTTNNVLKRRNNANTAWIVAASLDAARYEAKTATFTVGVDDINKLMRSTTAGYTVSFAAAATLGSNFFCHIKNAASTGDLTLDPDSSETINDASTLILSPGDDAFIYCDGSNLFAVTSDDLKDRINTFTKPQRAHEVADNDGDFDLDAGQNFEWSPTGTDQLSFASTSSLIGIGSQSGAIELDNASGHAITIDTTTVRAPDNMATDLSTDGRYVIFYFHKDGDSKVNTMYSEALT
jgi:hypothetical protein